MAGIRPPRSLALALAFLAISLAMPAPGAAVAQPSPGSMGVLWQTTGGHNATLWCCRWSPDGSLVAATYFDNTTEVYNSTTGQSIARLLPAPAPRSVTPSLWPKSIVLSSL